LTEPTGKPPVGFSFAGTVEKLSSAGDEVFSRWQQAFEGMLARVQGLILSKGLGATYDGHAARRMAGIENAPPCPTDNTARRHVFLGACPFNVVRYRT
jgi:hypothetical protein